MNFGRSIYCISSGDVLTVTSPIDSVFLACVLFFFLLIMGGFALAGKARRVGPWIGTAAIMTLIASVTTAHARVVLDGVKGKVYVTTVLFFHPTHYEYPLADIQGADVGASDQADALRLVFNSGSSLQLTPYNQMGGKGQAAFAINQFIRQHGGAGTPY